MHGRYEEVVEKMSKNNEKILAWWSVLEEHRCKCSDTCYISMSKRQLPVKKRISKSNSNFGYFAVATIQISRLFKE